MEVIRISEGIMFQAEKIATDPSLYSRHCFVVFKKKAWRLVWTVQASNGKIVDWKVRGKESQSE